MSYTIAPSIPLERLDHNPDGNLEAFGPDYTAEDIGSKHVTELTCTVFGYQLDEEAALLLIGSLTAYLYDSQHHHKLRTTK